MLVRLKLQGCTPNYAVLCTTDPKHRELKFLPWKGCYVYISQNLYHFGQYNWLLSCSSLEHCEKCVSVLYLFFFGCLFFNADCCIGGPFDSNGQFCSSVLIGDRSVYLVHTVLLNRVLANMSYILVFEIIIIIIIRFTTKDSYTSNNTHNTESLNFPFIFRPK